MPCSSRRSFAGRCHPRFHPYHLMMMAMEDPELREACSEASKEKGNGTSFVDSLVDPKARWNEDASDDHYSFQLDVPGVMAHNITIEEMKGDIEVTAIRFDTTTGDITKTFQESFFVKPAEAVLAETKATLKDGVLTILVPKKKPEEPVELKVEATDPPPLDANDQHAKELRVTVDLPGVKISDVQVHSIAARNGRALRMVASRTMGDGTIRSIRRLFKDDGEAPISDMKQARVFLQDGVLTLVAPRMGKEDDSEAAMDETQARMRTIHVTDEGASFTHTAFASLQLDEETDASNEMAVETVSAGEEKEWEQVAKKTGSD